LGHIATERLYISPFKFFDLCRQGEVWIDYSPSHEYPFYAIFMLDDDKKKFHWPGGGIFNLKDYKIHHIGIVVENIETAIKTYETVLGLTVAGIFDVEVFAAKVACR